MSEEPFPEALQALLDEREWSQRELSRQLQRNKPWGAGRVSRHGSLGAVNGYISGDVHPTAEAIEAVARVLQVKPEHFPEYRLERVRDALDWRKHGTAAALRALAALTD